MIQRMIRPVLIITALLVLATMPAHSAKSDAKSDAKSKTTGKDESVYAALAKAPKKAVTRANPLANDPDAATAGAKLFDQHCAECHGDMAQGGKKAPGLRTDEVQQAAPGTLFWILTNGVVRRGMPVWSKLPEPQRWQLVSYIKSLTPLASPDSPQAGNPPVSP